MDDDADGMAWSDEEDELACSVGMIQTQSVQSPSDDCMDAGGDAAASGLVGLGRRTRRDLQL